MAVVRAGPLFYAAEIPEAALRRLAAGVDEPPPVDVVEFPDEEGGDAERELGIPFLAGMDEVRVDAALLRLRAGVRPTDILGFTVVERSVGNDAGIVVALKQPARLRAVVLTYPTFPAPVTDRPERFTLLGGKVASRETGAEKPLRVVVRPATPQGGDFAFGPPVFAAPAFSAPGPLYDPVLAGLAVRDLTGGRLEVGFPSLNGPAWLIQLAHGDEPDALAPIPFATTVNRVTIDATPSNVSLVIASPQGDVALWSHPGAFVPEVGVQDVGFTPLAERTLAARLDEAKTAAPPATAAVPLRFHSDSGGAIEIAAKTLDAGYLVRPLGPDPVTLRLGGNWTPLSLSAPAGRRPRDGSARLVARLLGRELNGGSPEPSPARPTAGVRVGPARWVAASVPVEPLPGAAPGTPLPLASVCVYVAAPRDAELALELRRDAAGVPGSVVGPPLGARLAAGFSDWLEFDLAPPLTVVAGVEPVWVSLRTTAEEVLWFADGPGVPRLSGDRGETWATPEAALVAVGAPLLQLFHALSPPFPPPVLRLQHGHTLLADNLLAEAAPVSPTEFVQDGPFLSPSLATLLAATIGQIRATTEVQLFTRSVCDLTVEHLTLSYDPFAAGAGGG